MFGSGLYPGPQPCTAVFIYAFTDSCLRSVSMCYTATHLYVDKLCKC